MHPQDSVAQEESLPSLQQLANQKTTFKTQNSDEKPNLKNSFCYLSPGHAWVNMHTLAISAP
jgi:hypothetical protein